MASGTTFQMDGIDSLPSTSSSPPIQRLAPEILGEIFICCLPYPSNPTSFNDAPLLFLHVCHHWRQTARGTPRLWTDVNLTFRFKPLQPAQVLQMWLDNAGSLPLKINLPRGAGTPKTIEEVIELVLDNFHRISELKGFVMPTFSTTLLKHTLPIRAPFLKRLSIGGWDKLPSLAHLERLRGCMVVPQLEVCLLHSSRFQLSLLSLDPTRLRELHDLWAIEVAEFEPMEILTSFTSLQKLTIFVHPPLDVSVLKIPSVISIPSLRYLEIATFSGYDPNLFLRELDVPFIEHLGLHGWQAGDSPAGPLLDALTGGNIPPLKSFSLEGYNITSSGYMPWIRRFTRLETLTLGLGTIDDEFLNSLTCDRSSSPAFWICPALSTLRLKRIQFSWEAMQSLVQSRAPTEDGTGSLRKVIFETTEYPEESDRAPFTMIQQRSRGLLEVEFVLVGQTQLDENW